MMKNIFVSTIVLSLIVFPSDGLKLVGKVGAGIAGGVRKVSEKLKNRTKDNAGGGASVHKELRTIPTVAYLNKEFLSNPDPRMSVINIDRQSRGWFQFEKFDGSTEEALLKYGDKKNANKTAFTLYANATHCGGKTFSLQGTIVNSQEEATLRCFPGLYKLLAKPEFGLKNYDGTGKDYGKNDFSKEQLHYERDDMSKYQRNPDFINPSRGFAVKNATIAYENQYSRQSDGSWKQTGMKEIAPQEQKSGLALFLALPSFAYPHGADLVGTMLSGKTGITKADELREHVQTILKNVGLRYGDPDPKQVAAIMKLIMFTPKDVATAYIKELLQFYKNSSSKVLSHIMENFKEEQEKQLRPASPLSKSVFIQDVYDPIIRQAEQNYNNCLFQQFSNMFKLCNEAKSDTLIIGKIGCGVFRNDPVAVAMNLGRAARAVNSTIKTIVLAERASSPTELQKSLKPFIDNIKAGYSDSSILIRPTIKK